MSQVHETPYIKYTIEELNNMKLSQLALIALVDLRAIEEMQASGAPVAVSVYDWVRQDSEDVCYVCLAGAVLYRRCDIREMRDDCVPSPIPAFARAINLLRSGLVVRAIQIMLDHDLDARDAALSKWFKHDAILEPMPRYPESPQSFKTRFGELITELELAGL